MQAKKEEEKGEIEEIEEEDHVFNEKLQCRFYRKEFPEESDHVIT